MHYEHIDLSSMMRGGDEHEKTTLDGFMNRFFTALLEQVQNYRDPTSTAVPQPKDDDIVHIYMDNAGVGVTFAMDYAGHDRMTLVGFCNTILLRCLRWLRILP